MVATVWHGTEEEGAALERALERNCWCDPDRPGQCGNHFWDLTQRQLDGLVMMRRLAGRLWREETVEDKETEERWRRRM